MNLIEVLWVSPTPQTPITALPALRIRTTQVEDAEKAIEKWQTIPYDIIMVDTALPAEEITRLFRLIELQQEEAIAVHATFNDAEALRNTTHLFAQEVAQRRKRTYTIVENAWASVDDEKAE